MRSLRSLPSVFVAALALACSSGGTRPTDPAPLADPTSARMTTSGPVVGFVGRYGSHAWMGIPFAQPPVGELRWRAPRPPEPWTHERQALTAGSACVQFASGFGGMSGVKQGTVVGSEDCLFLNVYAPRAPLGAGAKLPVMLWIHGGGNTIGHAGFYDGGNLAQRENVVVVTTNYRLGVFGWYRHPAVLASATTPDDASGNFATLDLVRALEWVRDNAAAFGGDPDNVTIFGESAGARNVLSLVVSPRARGLFESAIAQSGGAGADELKVAEAWKADGGDANSGREIAGRIYTKAGRAADAAAARAALDAMPLAELEEFLRERSPAEILAVLDGSFAGMYRAPNVFGDGVVLPAEDFGETMARPGSVGDVTVVMGTNRDESKLFMASNPELVRRWLWLVPTARDPQRYDLDAEYQSKMWKATGADELAERLRTHRAGRVFVYRFDWDEEGRVLWGDMSQLIGAAHAIEIPFVFGHFDLGPQLAFAWNERNAAGREKLSAQMMSYWAEIAYTGDPGAGRRGDQPRWAPFDSSAGATSLILDTDTDGGVRMTGELVTRVSVLAQIEADARMPARADKCATYAILARWRDGFSPSEYEQVCGEYPLTADAD